MGRPETGSAPKHHQQQSQNQSEYDLQPQEYQYEASHGHEAIVTGGDDHHELAMTYETNHYVECQPQQQNNLQAQQQQLQQQQQPPPQQPQTNQAYGAQPPRPAQVPARMQQQNNQTYQNESRTYPPTPQGTRTMQVQPVKFPPASPQNNQMYDQNMQAQTNPVNFPPTAQDFSPRMGYQTPPDQGMQFRQTTRQMGGSAQVQGIPVQPVALQPMPAPIVFQQKVGWNSGLFDCMNDPMNALVTALFPCLTFGQVAEIVDEGHTSCGTSGMLYAVVAYCIAMPYIMSCTYRTKLRSKFGLLESPAPDWVTHFFCEWCALCQEYRELQSRGWDPSIGWQGNLARNQNTNQQQVAMMPPMNQRMMG